MEQFDYEPWPGPDHVPAWVLLGHLVDGMRQTFATAGRAWGKSIRGLSVHTAITDEATSEFVAVGKRIGTVLHMQIQEANKVAETLSKAFDIPAKPDVTKKVHGPQRVKPFSQRGPKRISAPDSARGCGIVSDRIGYRHGRR